MYFSTAGFHVLHCLSKFAQIYVSWCCYPTTSFFIATFSSCPQSSPASASFPVIQLFASGCQRIGAPAPATILPMNIQGRFPLGLTGLTSVLSKASLVAQMVKNLPAMPETWVWSLGWEDPLEKGTATHFSILAWRIPWTKESGSYSPWFAKLGATQRCSVCHSVKGLSRVCSSTTIQMHQFFGAQPCLWSNSHMYIWLLEKP